METETEERKASMMTIRMMSPNEDHFQKNPPIVHAYLAVNDHKKSLAPGPVLVWTTRFSNAKRKSTPCHHGGVGPKFRLRGANEHTYTRKDVSVDTVL